MPRIEDWVDVGEAVSGQVTVTTAGTAVQASASAISNNGFFIKALAGNAGVAYVGGDGAGDVASTNGYELSADQQIHVTVKDIQDLWFDAANNGDKFCWIKA